MKNKIYRRESFVYYDKMGIEERLNKMAERGWQLVRITAFYWQYQKIEPQKLMHQVVYASDALEEFTQHAESVSKEDQTAMWDYLTNWKEMRIYAAKQIAAPVLRKDQKKRLQSIHTTMKQSFLFTDGLLLLCSLLSLFALVIAMLRRPAEVLSDSVILCSLAIWFLILVICLSRISHYLFWYRLFQYAIQADILAAPVGKFYRNYTKIYEGMLLLFTFLLLVAVGRVYGTVIYISLFTIWFFLWGAWAFFRRRKNGETAVDWGIGLILGSAVLVLLLATSQNLNGHVAEPLPARVDTTVNSSGEAIVQHLYEDNLPLTLEDLRPIEAAVSSSEGETTASFLLKRTVGNQTIVMDDKDKCNLCYEIADLKFSWLAALYMNPWQERYKQFEMERYEKISDFGANGGCQLYKQQNNVYLLRWPKRIVTISFTWEPTQEQLSIVAEKLSPY